MKEVVLKSLIVLTLIVFVDYIIMIIVGCTSCLFGFSNEFYQCAFCTIGKIVLFSSILVFMLFVGYEIKSSLNYKKIQL